MKPLPNETTRNLNPRIKLLGLLLLFSISASCILHSQSIVQSSAMDLLWSHDHDGNWYDNNNDDDESERGVGREEVQKGEEKWKTPVDPLRALRLARAHAVGSRAPSDFLAVADSAKYCDRKGRRAVWRFVRSVATPPPELPAGWR